MCSRPPRSRRSRARRRWTRGSSTRWSAPPAGPPSRRRSRSRVSPRTARRLPSDLSKTIQAGMVIHELMLRRRIRRVLVLSPTLLRSQWRDETAEKFALPFEVVDRPKTLKLQRQLGLNTHPWRTHERIITSYD